MFLSDMFPEITVLGKAISSYGICCAAGILAAVLFVYISDRKLSNREAGDVEMIFWISVVCTVAGAKILSWITQGPSIIADIGYLFTDTRAFITTYVNSGFVFYGGLYGALIGALAASLALRYPYGDAAFRLSPVIPLFHGFGRIGCFLTGCCYGKEAFFPWMGIAFTHSAHAPNGIALYPVQLWEAAAEFILFFVLVRTAGKFGRETNQAAIHSFVIGKNETPRTDGARRITGYRMLGTYMLAYGILRFVLEFLRGDVYRGFIGALSVSQVISIPTIAIGAALLLYARRHRRARG